MVAPTQAEIDEAVMIAKNATYKLAYELALEQKYGGVIDCCVTKLKLLWMYEKALACHKEYFNAEGYVELLTVGDGSAISLRAGAETISSTYTAGTTNVVTEMIGLTENIRAYGSDYDAVFDSTLGTSGKIVITAPTPASATLTATLAGSPVPTATLTSFVGSATINCISDEKAKKLIAKIKSMCNTK